MKGHGQEHSLSEDGLYGLQPGEEARCLNGCKENECIASRFRIVTPSDFFEHLRRVVGGQRTRSSPNGDQPRPGRRLLLGRVLKRTSSYATRFFDQKIPKQFLLWEILRARERTSLSLCKTQWMGMVRGLMRWIIAVQPLRWPLITEAPSQAFHR